LNGQRMRRDCAASAAFNSAPFWVLILAA